MNEQATVADVWTHGVGRIKRRPYLLQVGAEAIDIAELRTYFPLGTLGPVLAKLDPPLTAAEALWVARFIRFILPDPPMRRHDEEQLDMLMAIVLEKQA
jgi:hypothetical protein